MELRSKIRRRVLDGTGTRPELQEASALAGVSEVGVSRAINSREDDYLDHLVGINATGLEVVNERCATGFAAFPWSERSRS
jgi:hypothetical protein